MTMVRLEIDIFNRKERQKLEAENLILKQQLANYRNEILEWNRRNNNDYSRITATSKG